MCFFEVTKMDQRRALAYRVLSDGCSVSQAAREFGVSRPTARLWVGRARQDLTALKRAHIDGPNTIPLGAYPIAPVYPAPPAGTPNAGIFDNIVRYAEKLKLTSGYTTLMGEDLGIVAPVSVASVVDPTFVALPQPNSEVRLNWVKGTSDGVIVEGQRNFETTWVLLATDRFSPYVDAREPLAVGVAETRRNRIRYLDGDTAVGNYSATVTATTVP